MYGDLWHQLSQLSHKVNFLEGALQLNIQDMNARIDATKHASDRADMWILKEMSALRHGVEEQASYAACLEQRTACLEQRELSSAFIDRLESQEAALQRLETSNISKRENLQEQLDALKETMSEDAGKVREAMDRMEFAIASSIRKDELTQLHGELQTWMTDLQRHCERDAKLLQQEPSTPTAQKSPPPSPEEKKQLEQFDNLELEQARADRNMLQQQLDDLQTAHHEAQTELIQLKKDAKKARIVNAKREVYIELENIEAMPDPTQRKRALKQLMLNWHPDKNADKEVAEAVSSFCRMERN